MTDLNVTYTPVRRDQKGLDKYGRGGGHYACRSCCNIQR